MCCVSSCTAGISFRGTCPVPPSLQHRRQQNAEAAIAEAPPAAPPRQNAGVAVRKRSDAATPHAGRAQRRLRRSRLEGPGGEATADGRRAASGGRLRAGPLARLASRLRADADGSASRLRPPRGGGSCVGSSCPAPSRAFPARDLRPVGRRVPEVVPRVRSRRVVRTRGRRSAEGALEAARSCLCPFPLPAEVRDRPRRPRAHVGHLSLADSTYLDTVRGRPGSTPKINLAQTSAPK